MEQQDNRRKKTASQSGRTSRPASKTTRRSAVSRTSTRSASSRARTSSGEPMSRDEVRSMKNFERRKRHRRNQLIGYAIAIVVVVIAAVVLSLTVFFKISNITVTGDEIYSNSEIIEASKLKNGDNLFTFSKADVKNDIERKLPYVESVEIKRSPTGKVTFTITAAKAKLAIDRGNSYILLSTSCKVLEENVQAINEDATLVTASELVSATPGVSAEFENENDAQTIAKIADIIEKNEILNINGIDITDYTDIKLAYNQRITLKVGSVVLFEKNADFIKATLEKIDTDEPYFSGVIDFTIENKAFINDNAAETTTQPSEEPKTDENGEVKTEKNTENTTEKADDTDTEKTTKKSDGND